MQRRVEFPFFSTYQNISESCFHMKMYFIAEHFLSQKRAYRVYILTQDSFVWHIGGS